MIALTGAQSTGKTTIFNALQTLNLDYMFIDSPTRKVACNINENGTLESQANILNETVKRAFVDHSIQDRCVLDTLVYTAYLTEHNKIPVEFLNINYYNAKTLLPRYKHIIYFKPEFDIVDDYVRSTSKEYRDSIVQFFDWYIKDLNINVFTPVGSVDERLTQILKLIGHTS